MNKLTPGILVIIIIILVFAAYKLASVPERITTTTTVPLVPESAENLAISEIEKEMEEAVENMTAEEVENALLS